MLDIGDCRRLIRRALAEDLGTRGGLCSRGWLNSRSNLGSRGDDSSHGDVSSRALFGPRDRSQFRLLAKDSGILCGMAVFQEVFRQVDRRLEVEALFQDGQRLSPGQEVARVRGPTASILTGERTALNFLSHLSAVASKTARFVDGLAEAGRQAGLDPAALPGILDTRKTVPGLRLLQKYAVSCGGGQNHRMGLYDMIMLKDNHIDAAGGISQAVAKARKRWGCRFKIEVETRTLAEVEQALAAGADRIMLDNMDDDAMRAAVRIVNGRAETEASGNMTLERLRGLADSGLSYVSFGELTHSVSVFDFSLKQERNL